MTKVSHPAAKRDASPAAVTVGTTTYRVDSDGIIECPAGEAEAVALALAEAHDCTADALLSAEPCGVIKSDGEVCGRELPCPYHSED